MARKLGQVGARLSKVLADALDLLGTPYRNEDSETRRQERLAVVDDRIFPALNLCAERGTFGSALRGLMVDASDLHAVLSETLNHPDPEPPRLAEAPAPRPRAARPDRAARRCRAGRASLTRGSTTSPSCAGWASAAPG